MRRIVLTWAIGMGLLFAGATPANALNPQPEPPGTVVVAHVAVSLFPQLPPGPCARVPSLTFVDNPVLPPNPCLSDGRGR